MTSSTTDNFGGRPTWAEIDLAALANNFRLIKTRVGPEVSVMAVVKANAYGHGAPECARALQAAGADWFAVALPEEGIELRNSGITKPILCLAGIWPGQAAICLRYNLVPVIYRLDLVEDLDRAARDAGRIIDVHLKIDTGMGRLGIRHDRANEFIDQLQRFANIRLDGLMSHFAAADDRTCSPLTEDQLKRFQTVASGLSERGYNLTHKHVANSAAIYGQPRAWQTMVRPGGVLYGLWRDVLPEGAAGEDLQPVMTLRSRITLMKWVPAGETIGYGCTFEASRRSLIATLPVGYDDGYMRGLSNRGHVVVRGKVVPVAGRISMDLTMIDVTDVPEVALDDEVTLFGGYAEKRVPVEDLARTVGTISYEVTCRVGSRVPRVFKNG